MHIWSASGISSSYFSWQPAVGLGGVAHEITTVVTTHSQLRGPVRLAKEETHSGHVHPL